MRVVLPLQRLELFLNVLSNRLTLLLRFPLSLLRLLTLKPIEVLCLNDGRTVENDLKESCCRKCERSSKR